MSKLDNPPISKGTRSRAVGLLGIAAFMAMCTMLSACNTTAGAGQDVRATGAAITRGANEVKSGL